MTTTRICPRCSHVFESPGDHSHVGQRPIPVHPAELLKPLAAHTPLYKRWNDDRAAGKPLPEERTP